MLVSCYLQLRFCFLPIIIPISNNTKICSLGERLFALQLSILHHGHSQLVVRNEGRCRVIYKYLTPWGSGCHHECELLIVQLYCYSKTSLNRTLLFQKVVRFSKISVYTKWRIAPANRTKFGLARGQSNAATRQNEHVNQKWRHASCKQIRTLFR